MVRYFEVLGHGDEVEYFGFMSTVDDRIVELEHTQFFCDYADFCTYRNDPRWERLHALVPQRVKQFV